MNWILFLSRPRVFILIMVTIVLVGGGTWAIDRYILQRSADDAAHRLEEGPTAARIVRREQLRVGVRGDFPPFGQVGQDETIKGFDADLAREFARRWLGEADAVDFHIVAASDRVPALATGEVDLLLAAMPLRRERDALIDFSQTYFVDGQSLLVRNDSAIRSLSDLENRTVAATQDSTALEQIQTHPATRNRALNVVAYPDFAAALAALSAGQIDALTADLVTLAQFARDNPGLRILSERLTHEPYGIGVAQGDSHLRALVNFTLQDMKRDGTYDRLYNQWFPNAEPHAIPISPGEWPHTLHTLANMQSNVQTDAETSESSATIDAILERDYILAGVSFDRTPFGSPNPEGAWEGFDLDILREFARRWLGDESAVQIIPAPSAENVARLAAREVDLVASGLVQRREWADAIDFSQTYLGAPLTTQPLSIGVPQDDAAFRELVNVTLQEMMVDGTYEALQARWFGPDRPTFALEVLPGDADYLLLPYRDQETTPRFTAANVSTIGQVQARNNTLVAGVRHDLAPFGFLDAEGNVVGFDADLIRAMAAQWGVAVEFVPVTPSDRVQKLVAGEVDIVAAAMPHTKEQEAQIDFSQTYFVNGQNLLTQNDRAVRELADLNGRRVAAVQGSTALDLFQAHADANGLLVEITPYPSYEAALDALRNGQVAVLTADNVVLSQFAKSDPELRLLDALFAQEPYGLGLPPGDSYFNDLVNFTLQSLKEEGTYDELYRAWFGEEATPHEIELLPGAWPYTFAESPTTLDKPVRSKVEEIRAAGQIIAGVQFDSQPFGYLDETDELVGFDIDLLREFAKRWLGDANAVEFVPVTAANRIDMLAADEVDIIAAAMTHQRQRDELIEFSQTYFQDSQGVLVRADAGIATLRDLDGRIVAAVQGSTAIDNMLGAAESQAISLEILPFQEQLQALEALKAGQVDALTAPLVALEQYAQADPALVVAGESFATEPYGLGMPNYDDRFQDLVNFTLQEMKLDGTYERLFAKWFARNAPHPIEIWPGESYLDVDLAPMVRVPAGEFVRGYADGFPDERVEKTIYVDEFYIDQYEVTNRHYARCVQAGRCTLPRLPRSVNFGRYYAESDFGNYPVIWVSWDDAAAYCAFRGKRLPTEAEWERAARGPENWLYPWGDEAPTTQANFNYMQRDVAPVGSFVEDVSAYGAHDMAGNVREWVADWYQWDYYPVAPEQNPQGPATGVTKVLRGGSWNDVAVYLRSTVRKNFLPESYDSNLGFRCASSSFPPGG